MENQPPVVRNDEGERYELYVNGLLASFLEFHRDDGKLVLDHTETRPRFKGQGCAEDLIAGALQDIRTRGEEIVPKCEFVAKYLDKHPEASDLVSQNA